MKRPSGYANIAIISGAVYHDIRDFTARVLATLPVSSPPDFRQIAPDMIIMACQTRSELKSNTTID